MGTSKLYARATSHLLSGLFTIVPSVLLSVETGEAAILYAEDGVLDHREEAQRWLINRARYAPEREADRLGLVNTSPGGSPNYDVCEDTMGVNDFGTTTNDWSAWIISRGPLAANALMSVASDTHSLDMIETGQFQHPSPSANYYPLHSTPVQRTSAEGYNNQISGFLENLTFFSLGSTAGYPDVASTGTEVHEALFVDEGIAQRGHRQAILNFDAREIGIGFRQNRTIDAPFFVTSDFDTQDFGKRNGHHFFTGTMFHDADNNSDYDEREGIEGIEVRLYQDGSEADYYDVSNTSGGFAVPLGDLIDGRSVSVQLVNANSTVVTLSIPIDFDTLGEIDLAPGETYSFATFVQPNDESNLGFRNLSPNVDVSISKDSSGIRLHFEAIKNASYLVESNDEVELKEWTTVEIVTPTVTDAVVIDTGQGGGTSPDELPVRCYRVQLLKN